MADDGPTFYKVRRKINWLFGYATLHIRPMRPTFNDHQSSYDDYRHCVRRVTTFNFISRDDKTRKYQRTGVVIGGG
jgi:hypothetical protein